MFGRLLAIAAVAGLFAISGCGAGSGGIGVNSVNPTSPSYSSLQFAVGTANLYGKDRGLNVVSTLRQPDGDSALGADTPTISGPFVVTALAVPSYGEIPSNSGFPDPYTTVINGGPSLREFHRSAVSGTAQTVAPGTPACDRSGGVPNGFVSCPNGLSPNTTTFGQSGGVFAMGLQPANVVANTGQAYSYAPYAQPFYVDAAASKYEFVPWGGPPAFDPFGDGLGTRDGVNIQLGDDSFGDPYFLGIGEGITVFDGMAARSGTYTLAVAVSTIGSGGSVSTTTISKRAHLDAAVLLPTLVTPVFHPNGKGGGTFTVALPHGVTQGYVQIVDWGPGGGPHDGAATQPANCQGARGTSFAPVYYTVEITKAAKTTYRLPDTIGPNSATTGGKGNITPSPSICTAAQNQAKVSSSTPGDDIVVQFIGFDYPAYEAAHGLIEATTPQNPPIVGSGGQSNITISDAAEQDNGSTTQTPLVVTARPHGASRFAVRR
ncbi:MAG TPA: hypothetical protein VMH02_04410 [Verrucomicrobiae bacterium]|nr:hypothetical protein [Verrucomicrobiae bacterium]